MEIPASNLEGQLVRTIRQMLAEKMGISSYRLSLLKDGQRPFLDVEAVSEESTEAKSSWQCAVKDFDNERADAFFGMWWWCWASTMERYMESFLHDPIDPNLVDDTTRKAGWDYVAERWAVDVIKFLLKAFGDVKLQCGRRAHPSVLGSSLIWISICRCCMFFSFC